MSSFPSSAPIPLDAARKVWRAWAEFSGKELFFQDHFPGKPIVPGVLLVEILRANAERALLETGFRVRLVEASRVRFVHPVEPPARLEARIELGAANPFEVKGELTDPEHRKVATAVLLFEQEVETE